MYRGVKTNINNNKLVIFVVVVVVVEHRGISFYTHLLS